MEMDASKGLRGPLTFAKFTQTFPEQSLLLLPPLQAFLFHLSLFSLDKCSSFSLKEYLTKIELA
jgi:hypothetical protein